MIELYGNTQELIDWDTIIDSIKSKPGRRLSVSDGVFERNEQMRGLVKLWTDNNLNLDSMLWINYYPDIDFDSKIIDIFSDFVGAKFIRAWISRVDPGYYVGYHTDYDDHMDDYLKLGNLVRYTCCMNKPNLGQVTMIKDDYLVSQAQGNVYRWDHYTDWHASSNFGLSPKFQFNFLGYN